MEAQINTEDLKSALLSYLGSDGESSGDGGDNQKSERTAWSSPIFQSDVSTKEIGRRFDAIENMLNTRLNTGITEDMLERRFSMIEKLFEGRIGMLERRLDFFEEMLKAMLSD